MLSFEEYFLAALSVNGVLFLFLVLRTYQRTNHPASESTPSSSKINDASITQSIIPCPQSLREEECESQIPTRRNDSVLHQRLLLRYLPVYIFAVFSDWLQGPYIYSLYSSYNFTEKEISQLFIMGYGSSMIFGTFVGGMADRRGRKKYAIYFCYFYGLSCLSKHFNNFWILLFGRMVGGISTSLLFSVFESWFIKAHANEKLDKSYISKSLSITSYCNSIIAIIAGLVSHNISYLNSITLWKIIPIGTTTTTSILFYFGGCINTFDVAFISLFLCATLASLTWDENYGKLEDENHHDHQEDPSNITPEPVQNLQNAYKTCFRNGDILICGIISSLFEASMYIFVFLWTPKLESLSYDTLPNDISIPQKSFLPHGLIFSTFMVHCMIGSSIYSLASQYLRCEILCFRILVLATISMCILDQSQTQQECMMGMNLFETCVGMYFPAMGTMKSTIVPENQRSAIYNMYRIPMNFIVLTSLIWSFENHVALRWNTIMIGFGCLLQWKLMKNRSVKEPDTLGSQ